MELDAVLVAVVTGIISSIATVVALKVDIAWLKRWTADHARDDREAFSRLETRLNQLEVKT